ncbi:HEPN domain-containing protein [archaeon]|nr:HEPN domain-containing protein [archaeon]
MKRDLKELLRKGIIEKTESDKEVARSLMRTADNDIQVAKDNLKANHHDWALAIAYNAMLSAGRTLMTTRGYRTCGGAHHLTVVLFNHPAQRCFNTCINIQ